MKKLIIGLFVLSVIGQVIISGAEAVSFSYSDVVMHFRTERNLHNMPKKTGYYLSDKALLSESVMNNSRQITINNFFSDENETIKLISESMILNLQKTEPGDQSDLKFDSASWEISPVSQIAVEGDIFFVQNIANSSDELSAMLDLFEGINEQLENAIYGQLEMDDLYIQDIDRFVSLDIEHIQSDDNAESPGQSFSDTSVSESVTDDQGAHFLRALYRFFENLFDYFFIILWKYYYVILILGACLAGLAAIFGKKYSK